ncbi:MAG: hypothetical protein HYS35_00435 [Betaproteobacteria bacterium]|nr:hypothetical protein [Betaproteobacteria bacterium]
MKAGLPREEQSGHAKSWWKIPGIYALATKETLPVAGVLVAGWDVVPLVYMFWFETLVIYVVLVLIVALPRLDLLPDPSESKSLPAFLTAGAFILGCMVLGFLMATFTYLIAGGWIGAPVVAELLSRLDASGTPAGGSWNPLDVIDGVARLARRDLSLGAAMVLLAGTYAFEVAATLRSTKRPEPPASYTLVLVTQAPWKVWDLFLPRLAKLGLFNMLMWIVFGVAISIREVPEAAGWSLALVVALKLALDVSSFIREQTHEDKRAASLVRFNARIGRSTRRP